MPSEVVSLEIHRADSAIFDAEAALERTGDDTELLEEILGLFCDQLSPVLSDIEGALARRDGPALERAAHSLKGAAANISAEEVRAAAWSLEDAGRRLCWEEAAAAQAALETALPRLMAAIASQQTCDTFAACSEEKTL